VAVFRLPSGQFVAQAQPSKAAALCDRAFLAATAIARRFCSDGVRLVSWGLSTEFPLRLRIHPIKQLGFALHHLTVGRDVGVEPCQFRHRRREHVVFDPAIMIVVAIAAKVSGC